MLYITFYSHIICINIVKFHKEFSCTGREQRIKYQIAEKLYPREKCQMRREVGILPLRHVTTYDFYKLAPMPWPVEWKVPKYPTNVQNIVSFYEDDLDLIAGS